MFKLFVVVYVVVVVVAFFFFWLGFFFWSAVGRIRVRYANPRRSREFAQLSRILPTPRVSISGYAITGNKFSIAFVNVHQVLLA